MRFFVKGKRNLCVVEYWPTAVGCWLSDKKVSLGFRSRKKLATVEENCGSREVETCREKAEHRPGLCRVGVKKRKGGGVVQRGAECKWCGEIRQNRGSLKRQAAATTAWPKLFNQLAKYARFKLCA